MCWPIAGRSRTRHWGQASPFGPDSHPSTSHAGNPCSASVVAVAVAAAVAVGVAAVIAAVAVGDRGV